jgi:hypothetical protein
MAVVTLAELKTYFETGDKPTEQQFINLIDTLASMPAGLTNQQLDAINAANNPNSGNPFATILDTIISIDITNANLITAITNSTIQIGVKYRVLDCPQGVVWIWGIDANVVSRFAALEGDWDGTNYVQGLAGTYDVTTNLFLEQGRFFTAPSSSEDDVHGYYVGQLLTTLDTGVTYKCTDASTGAAVWQAQSGEWTPTLGTPNGAITSASVTRAYQSVQGDICTATVVVNISADFSIGNEGSVAITDYPIPTSSFLPNPTVSFGKLISIPLDYVIITIAEDTMTIKIFCPDTYWTFSDQNIIVNFQYKIIP